MGSVPLLALQGRGASDGGEQGIRNALGVQAFQQQAALAPGQQQLQQQQVQQQQQQLNDQKAMTAAMQQWDGKDPNDLPGLILKNHGSAQAVFGTKTQILSQQKMLNEADDATLTNLAKRNDIQLGKLNTLKDIPDDQLPQAMQSLAQEGLQNKYLDAQHAQGLLRLASQGPDAIKAQLPILEKQLQGGATQFANQIKDRETKASELKAQADAQKADTEAKRFSAELPGGALQPVDKAEMADWLKKNPGKGPAEFLAYKATLVPRLQFNLNNQGGSGPQSDSVINAVAAGQMKIQDAIPMRAPVQVRQQFLAKVLQANPNFKSYDNEVDKKIIEDLTSGGKSNTLLAYNTALKHADIFSRVADALDNGDSRALNSLGNTLGTQFGSDKATNFGIAKTLFADEFAKAATGANVGVTDREKAQELLSSASSPAQFKGAVATAKALLAGKRDAMMEQAKQGMQGKADFGQGNSADPAKPWEKYPVHQ